MSGFHYEEILSLPSEKAGEILHEILSEYEELVALLRKRAKEDRILEKEIRVKRLCAMLGKHLIRTAKEEAI